MWWVVIVGDKHLGWKGWKFEQKESQAAKKALLKLVQPSRDSLELTCPVQHLYWISLWPLVTVQRPPWGCQFSTALCSFLQLRQLLKGLREGGWLSSNKVTSPFPWGKIWKISCYVPCMWFLGVPLPTKERRVLVASHGSLHISGAGGWRFQVPGYEGVACSMFWQVEQWTSR